MDFSTLRLVLDLYDTLYAERDYVHSGFDAVGRFAAQQIGVTDFSERCWRLFLGGRRTAIFDTALTELLGRADSIIVEQFVDVYRNHHPQITLYEDAQRLLQRKRAAGAPLGLITDGHAVSQHAKLKSLGLKQQLATYIVTADLEGERQKPHPAAFNLLQQGLGPSGQFVYVGDNPAKDFLTPNALGWISIRIRRPEGIYTNDKAPSFNHEARGTITSLDEVDEFLRSLTAD